MDTIDVARKACAQWRRASCKKIPVVLGMLLATFVLCASPARADDIQYAYDELGRLVQASNLTSGEAVLYTYDAAGNITSQITRPLTTLSIGHFTPGRGPIGAQVTINGTGFSATPASNVVRFNGTAATVLSASQTQILATVPAAATTGPISVEVGAATATSNVAFTVTATGDTPTITALVPPAAALGSAITIVGTNFEPVLTQNRVRLSNTTVPAVASSPTSINFIVPANTGSGRVRVTTPRGLAISPTDFIVTPPGYSTSQIVSTGRIESDGTATTLTFSAPSKIGVRLFEGTVGDLLAIGVSALSLPSVTLKVYAPNGQLLVSGSNMTSAQGLQLPKLTATGTYTIVVDAGANTGSVSLGVFKPVLATLTMSGAATNVNLTPPGRRALLTFAGTQGTYANVSVGSVAFAGTLSVISPTGAVLASTALNASGTLLQPLLPGTGTYSVLLDPTGSVGGTAAVSVAASATPTLVANSTGHTINLNNQTPVSVTFRGEPGQYMSILVGVTSSTSFSASAAVRNPDGTSLTSTFVQTTFSQGGTMRGTRIMNFGPLQFGGTYTVVVQQSTSVSGSVGLRLTSAQIGTLNVNSASSATISVPGQSVLRSFVGSAGQYVSFALAEAGGGISGANITVLSPDGLVLTTGEFTPPLAKCGVIGGDPVFRCGRAVVNMGPLMVSGTYQILVQQRDSQREEDDYTGSYSLVLSTPISGTVVADSSAAEPTIQFLGQGMKYTFAGTQGQYLSAGLVSTAQFPEGTVSNPVTAVVLDPAGTAIAAGSLVVVRHGVTVVSWFGSGVVNMGPLPVSGTYTLLLLQSGQALNDVTSLSIGLSGPLTGSLSTSSPGASQNVQRSGQGLLYTFPCAAGEYVSGALATASSNITAARITVLGADGAALASRDMSTILHGGAAGSYDGSTVVNAGPLPSSGSCALLAQQTGSGESNTGQLSLRWSQALTGTLTLDAQTGVAIDNSGQGLLYSFDANAGDYRAITVSVEGADSAIKSASISVLGPTGAVVASGSLSTVEIPGPMTNPPTYEGAALLNLGPLGATGTYKLLVQQTGFGATQTGSFGIVLSQPVPGSVSVGGSANAPLGLRGQGARYTFSGSGGQHVSLRVFETNGQVSSASVKILDPTGSVLKSATLGATPLTCTGCNGYTGTVTVDSGLLPATGTYAVLVQQTALPPFDTDRTTPYMGGVGTLTLELTELQPGTGSTTNISTTVPGQAASLTFPAVAGQSISVALTNMAIAPAGSLSYFINIYGPTNNFVASAACMINSPCGVVHVRQLTQTGTHRVEVVPPAGRTISGTVTISSALTGALSVGTPVTLNASTLGQAAHFAFTAATASTFALELSSLSTVPANTQMFVSVFNSAGTSVGSASTTTSGVTLNLPNLAADTYYVWVAPQYPATSTMQVKLHPRVGSTVATDGTSSNFSALAPGQTVYYDFAAVAGQSVSLALTNMAASPAGNAQYFVAVYAPNGTLLAQPSCFTNAACDVVHLRNLPQTGTYRAEVFPPNKTYALSGTFTASLAQTGTLNTGVPVSLNLSKPGQAAHLGFTAAVGDTFAVELSSLSTTPANTRMTATVFNSAGGSVATQSTTSSGLTMNLRNLAAGSYYVWLTPQFSATSTLQVTLHPGVGGPIATDGTPANFSALAPGQAAYYTFAAVAGDSVSVALTNMAASPAGNAQYFVAVYAPNGTLLAQPSCFTNTACDVAHLRNLAQTGNYRVEVYPANAMYILSGTISVSLAQTGTLSPDVPLDLTLNVLGQAAHLSFTATAGQRLSVDLGPLSTTPAGTRITINVYNSAGTFIGGTNSMVGFSYLLPTLAAGTYYVWVTPQYPVTSTVRVTIRPAVVVATDGSATSFDTTALGQKRYFTFIASAGQNVSVALSDGVTSPSGSAATYTMNVYRPDGQNVASIGCPNTAVACDVIHLRNLQTGTYLVEISPPVTHTLSGTLTLTQALTGTLTSGVPVNVTLPLLGQSMLLDMVLSAAQTVSIAATSISTSPAGRTMTIWVLNSSGNQLAGNSGTTSVSVNMGTLAAGSYKVAILPKYPSTSSMVVGY